MSAGSLRVRIARATHRVPMAHQLLRTAYRKLNGVLPARRVPGLPGRVHRNDLMLADWGPEAIEAYRTSGQAALGFIADGLEAAGRDFASVESAVDFGCGHGRVLRHLVERVPPSRITACDLDPEAVAFCAREFGVRPLVGDLDITKAPPPPADLVWLGSVFTHLDRPTFEATFRQLADGLTPGGVMVFSLVGARSMGGIAQALEFVAEAAPRLSEDLARDGMAYIAYPHYSDDGYGLAVHAPDFVAAAAQQAGLETLWHREGVWVTHDVVALRRPATTGGDGSRGEAPG